MTEPPAALDAPHDLVTLELAHGSCVSFAMYQNYVPLVHRVTIDNRRSTSLEELELTIWTEPMVCAAHTVRIDRVPPASVYHLDQVDLALLPEQLATQNERQRGQLRAELRAAGEVVAREQLELDVLAYDEWPGIRSMPEILAAFVLPNHPAVARILKAASKRLAADGGRILSGYQTRDPADVRAQLAAIYDSVCALDLGYVGRPASFEEDGQKIRTPERVVSDKLANCIDLATTIAACLEQAGLNPLLILQEDHALVGAWLTPDHFGSAVLHEGLVVRKRVDLDLIAVIESTCATQNPPPTAAEALVAGRRTLADLNRFVFALDVAAARQARVLPLPLRVFGVTADLGAATDESGAAGPEPSEPEPEVRAPRPNHDVGAAAVPAAATPARVPLDDTPPDTSPPTTPPTPSSRLDVWKHHLLDLSLRNRLLNHRSTKTTIPLLCADLPGLEDALASDRAFRISPRPKPLGTDDDPRDSGLYAARHGEVPLHATLVEALRGRRLHADLDEAELDHRLTKLYREARSSREEGGANLLYAAIGFLQWFEADASKMLRRAPILLLPLELLRPSIKAGFTVRLSGEEPRINITLLEKLRTEFDIDVTGLDELLEDEAGVDVPRLLERVRAAVLPFDRWDVVEDAAIGLFSFTKFLMWRDLHQHTDRLLTNPIVRHLVEQPQAPFDPAAEFPDPATLDDRPPERTYCPLNADSSQLAAIFAAAEGRSFVLQGPPGTGKSQTITNLIAHCLAEGKRTLFVSEKIAALQVVHQRLSSVGLGPFCLELHSNRAVKKQVLQQLGESLATSAAGEPTAWRTTAAKLEEARGDLNHFCRLLHQRRVVGVSAFQGISTAIGLRDAQRVEIDLGTEDRADGARLEQLTAHAEQLALATQAVGGIAEHPLRPVRRLEWDRSVERRFAKEAAELEQVTASLDDAARATLAALGLIHDHASRGGLDALALLANRLGAAAAPTRALLEEGDWGALRERLRSGVAAGVRRDSLRTEVGEVYREAILDLDLEDLRQRLRRSLQSMFPLSWFRRRRVVAALRSVRRDGGRLGRPSQLATHLDGALDWRAQRDAVALFGADGNRYFGQRYQGGEADWSELGAALEWTDEVRGLWARLARELDGAAQDQLQGLLRVGVDGVEREAALDNLRAKANALGSWLGNLDASEQALDDLLELAPPAFGALDQPAHLTHVAELARTFAAHHRELRAWTAYNRARKAALEGGLAPLVEAVHEGRLEHGAVVASFAASFWEWWVGAVLAAEPLLSHFQGTEHEHKIARFRELDAQATALAREVVFARLAARLPQLGGSVAAGASSEVGILQRQLKKQRGHWPIRRLIRTVPNLLPRLKPCFLMSPLSVAQYLDAEMPPFDLVVFDEASQIPVWDAIGAIARGARLVVVGDSRQLPPTSFFDRAAAVRTDDVDAEDEADEEMVEELESILDECVAAQVPTRDLLWHYRSRHESLIAFSNHHYYDNRLLTFPSAQDQSPDLGVSWRYIADGVYDRSKSRANRAEAEAVVAEIVARTRAGDQRSIGVVTFAQPQQALIEDVLDRARLEDPNLDAFLSSDREEPLFIKNLENVQGDERDVILFSGCYGPDAQGRIYMNFGPLNRAGGERRLNVAITRAKQQVVVFSTLLPEHIDLARISPNAVGVRHLKTFLEYAQRGPSALAEAITLSLDAEWDSPFERDVHRALADHGHVVQCQVGCSGYRIDLAIVHPDAPGHYVLGIECDGATYHSAKAARDRDRLRQSVLESLGWTLHRVWSTDWFCDRATELRRLLVAIDDALASNPPRTAEPTALAPSPEPRPDPEVAETSPVLAPYAPATLAPLGVADDFYSSDQDKRIRGAIKTVLEAEAPVSFELLLRRVATAHDVKRITARVRSRILDLLDEVPHQRETVDGDRTFLWRANQDPVDYSGYRPPGADDSGDREPTDIPPVELANAAAEVLTSGISLATDDLVRETARVFGFQRVGRQVDEEIRAALELLCERGAARREGDRLVLP